MNSCSLACRVDAWAVVVDLQRVAVRPRRAGDSRARCPYLSALSTRLTTIRRSASGSPLQRCRRARISVTCVADVGEVVDHAFHQQAQVDGVPARRLRCWSRMNSSAASIICDISSMSAARLLARLRRQPVEAERQARQRRAQVVCDRADHLRALAHQAVDTRLHRVERSRRAQDLRRPFQRQPGARRVLAHVIGGARRSGGSAPASARENHHASGSSAIRPIAIISANVAADADVGPHPFDHAPPTVGLARSGDEGVRQERIRAPASVSCSRFPARSRFADAHADPRPRRCGVPACAAAARNGGGRVARRPLQASPAPEPP